MKTLRFNDIISAPKFTAAAREDINAISSDVAVPRLTREMQALCDGRDDFAVYLGGSFGKSGTDRKVGAFIQSIGGVVGQVLNDCPDNSPGSGSFRPDFVLPNPKAAAALLGAMAARPTV